jgi:hypothetical protein
MATKKRPAATPAGKEKRVHGIGGASVPPPPIFSNDVSDMVPGELILQLDANAAASVTESIPRGPLRGLAVATTSFGVPALDQALAKLKATSVARLHPPAPIESRAMTEAVALGDTFRVTFDKRTPADQAARQMAQVSGVQYAEPNRYRETMVVPNDPGFASQWGLAKINAPAAWDRTTGAAGVVVAVIDTRVDLNHPERAPLLGPRVEKVDLGPNTTPPPRIR